MAKPTPGAFVKRLADIAVPKTSWSKNASEERRLYSEGVVDGLALADALAKGDDVDAVVRRMQEADVTFALALKAERRDRAAAGAR